MAEGVGFEPTELSLNGFQDRRLKPLGHPSAVLCVSRQLELYRVIMTRTGNWTGPFLKNAGAIKLPDWQQF